MRNVERGNVGLIVLGVLILLGGLVALGLVVTDSMNSAEVGTAKKVAAACITIGAIGIFAGFSSRKKSG